MKELRFLIQKPNRINRFFYQHRHKGIPNLMLYISIGSAVVYFMTMMAGNAVLYNLLRFDRAQILKGQVWRLFTYIFTYQANDTNLFLVLISLYCFYALGSAIERAWGTFRFNLFYLTGIVLMDIYAMALGGIKIPHGNLLYDCSSVYTDMVYYLNLSLLIAFATLYPDAQFLFFFIIPVKAWIFGLLDLILTLYSVYAMSFQVDIAPMFPHNLFPLVAIANYFLFFGKDVMNLIPLKRRPKVQFQPKRSPSRPIPMNQQPKATYTHRCTICGRTDVSNPELEFRYCSRCKGYFCYCQAHISNHTHVE